MKSLLATCPQQRRLWDAAGATRWEADLCQAGGNEHDDRNRSNVPRGHADVLCGFRRLSKRNCACPASRACCVSGGAHLSWSRLRGRSHEEFGKRKTQAVRQFVRWPVLVSRSVWSTCLPVRPRGSRKGCRYSAFLRTTTVAGSKYGARYLGYGVMEAFARRGTQAGQLTRSCLRSPVRPSPFGRAGGASPRNMVEDLVEHALIAVGVCSVAWERGVASGYGSLNLRSLSRERSRAMVGAAIAARLAQTVFACFDATAIRTICRSSRRSPAIPGRCW